MSKVPLAADKAVPKPVADGDDGAPPRSTVQLWPYEHSIHVCGLGVWVEGGRSVRL